MTIGPYGAAADLYLAKGWGEVLPLPPGQKTPPPSGYTGAKNVDVVPTPGDIARWKQTNGDGNLALRMPRGVVGIDVDAYDGKAGQASLATAIEAWGELPSTWRVTSRLDGVSGIRFFRVPEGLHWPSIVGPGIEMIHRGHRYAVAWPSFHPEGGQYVWLREGQNGPSEPPTVQDLPFLPDNWVAGLTGGEEERQTTPAGASTQVLASTLEDWETAGSPCRQVLTKVAEVDAALTGDAGSRHDRVRDRLLKVIRLGQVGHAGVGWAMDHIGELFVDTIGRDRGHGTAEHEWQSILRGGVDLILGDLKAEEPCYGDRCEAGRIPSLDHLPTVNAPSSPLVSLQIVAEENEAARSLWADLGWVLTGEVPVIAPASILARTDDPGACLFYRGKVNGVFGEPETAKTWLALHAIVEELARGGSALFIDVDHNGAVDLVTRLLSMGAQREHIGDPSRFRIAEPETWMDFVAMMTAIKSSGWLPGIVVLDSLGEVIPMLGASSKDNDEITKVMRVVAKPFARVGAAVITIDHTAKGDDDSGYAIGGTAKKRMIDGTYVKALVHSSNLPRPGHIGKVTLLIEKDRAGTVRKWTSKSKHFGSFFMDSREGGLVECSVQPPETPGEPSSINAELGIAKDREMRRRVMDALAEHQRTGAMRGLSSNAVWKKTGGGKDVVADTLRGLESDGYVTSSAGSRNSTEWKAVRPYDELIERVQEAVEGTA